MIGNARLCRKSVTKSLGRSRGISEEKIEMELLFTVLLVVAAVYFFADVFILFGIRLIAFTFCALTALFSFKLIANFLIWLGLAGNVAWVRLISTIVVASIGWCAIRFIGLRAANAAATMSNAEALSLDSVRTGLVSAFSVLVSQAALSASSGAIVAFPWAALVLMIVLLSTLDLLAPKVLHRVAISVQLRHCGSHKL